ncbi:6-phospho-beta-glucosidase [Bacillus altitudinis MN12]|jgi:6-phospho-beta-glucosidase|uniref:6-phospho-beta-glucosidase n=4 Tax=Bacillaceae TaxID=186817 RepID=A0A653XS26_BACAB|nr:MULTISPECIES: 6-phospho-beta-glucosidase [Bacillus]AMM90821.1 diacetylchitobiose-6-phosphate hydrolase [Bacillus pumilus]EMI14367.1 6-phospho-beta-glucosidase [Bacillus stratosphericus LAMA 585]KML05370.1 diacetylchitobiose-6-phosphate hydrolase [Bacillus stratosphericus]KQL42914.1 diacetylchitobiose-6-phosphate hydrolase [Bacillus sp. FJAT-21955]MBX7000730.1 6-phospho-beta-glucosidase [Bacillus aerophilus]CVN02598.1 6-phospho-beta-glucosidase [Streptococcus pneumoniae]
MKDGIKIVTIGGGSSYTPELVEGFIKRYQELPVKELWLVDIEAGQEKLNIVGALAKRMVEKAGLPIEVHLTLDRRAALKDADFVTTQFRVGLLEARAKDERIPLKYGVIGQETNGPGGLFKGLRTIPVILDIVKDMEELCPDAWLVNFTNPAGMVTEAVLRYTNLKKVVGLCNVPIGIKMGIAKALDVDVERIEVQFAGLNHMVYGLDVYLDGVSIMDQVLDELGNPNSQWSMRNIEAKNWEPSFVKGLGVIPCPYHRYYYKTKDMLEEEQKAAQEKGTRAEVVQQVEHELFELYKDPDLSIKPPQLEKRGGAYYSDAACNLISSIYNDKHDIQPVNTVNRGAIASIPAESAVEVNCIITKDGPKPIATGDLPVAVRGLVQQIKSFERVAAEAAVTGDYETALVAMTINPLVPSDEIAKQILDEMLEAHREYLPQFFKSVNA